MTLDRMAELWEYQANTHQLAGHRSLAEWCAERARACRDALDNRNDRRREVAERN